MSSSDPFQRSMNRLTDKITDGMIHAALTLVVMFVRPIATLTEIFFRRRMGERYFTYWNVIGGFFVLIACHTSWGVPQPAPGGSDYFGRYTPAQSAIPMMVLHITFVAWVAALFCALGLHAAGVKARYQAGGRWHSRNNGIPWISSTPSWVERVVPILGAIALWRFGHVPSFALLMIVSTGVSFMLRVFEARSFRERVMDVIDGQIEQEFLAKSVMERSKPEAVDGLQTPLPAYVSQKVRQNFIEEIEPETPEIPPIDSKPAAVPSTPPASPTVPLPQSQNASVKTPPSSPTQPSPAPSLPTWYTSPPPNSSK